MEQSVMNGATIEELIGNYREHIETMALIDPLQWQARTLDILSRWALAPAEAVLEETKVRASLMAAWELHPLPARLERQIMGLQDQSERTGLLQKACELLPHRLVEVHWKLVRKAAGRYHIPTEADREAEFQELLSVGREALFIAAQKFYRRPRGSFRNFAWMMLRQNMREEQARRHPVPAKVRKKLGALQAMRESYRLADKPLSSEAMELALRLNSQELMELLKVEAIWGNGLEFETELELEELAVADQGLDQLAFLLEIEDMGRIDQALEHIEGIQRELILQIYFQERSLRDVATSLQLSLAALKKLHKRALLSLRTSLQDETDS